MSTPTNPQLTPAQLNFSQTDQWKAILRNALAELRVAIPAIVQEFDETTQTVTVQIALRETIRTPTGPKDVAINPIFKIPIVLPRAGGFSLTMPISAGDEGMLVFWDMCVGLWWSRGGVQNQIGRHRHEVSDCVFVPGCWSQPNVLEDYSTDSAQLRSDDGTVVVDVAEAGITLTAPKVTIASSGDVDITASGNVNIQGQKITGASAGNNTEIDGRVFLTHQHTLVQTGGSDSGPVL